MNLIKTNKLVPVHVKNNNGEIIGHFEKVSLKLLVNRIEFKFGKGLIDRTKLTPDLKFSVNLFEGEEPIVISSKSIEKFAYSKINHSTLMVVLELEGWEEVENGC